MTVTPAKPAAPVQIKDMVFVKGNAQDGESAPPTVIGGVVRDFYINTTEVPIHCCPVKLRRVAVEFVYI